VQTCHPSPWVARGADPRKAAEHPKPGEKKETHWIEVKLTAQPDLSPRPDYWPAKEGGSCYAAERFTATITHGPDDGSLDGQGTVRYDDIPAGSCQIRFHKFHEEIQRFFDEQLS
jgi:hypothetical protein